MEILLRSRCGDAGARALPNAITLKPFESTIFASGSRIAAFLKSSAVFKPLLAARRKMLTERVSANMTFVDEISPFAAQGPR
ncbi:hypothetical protein ACU4GR_22150 [Methylobacterium oryzae CBMB20]